jgi:hypothetical protein
VKEDTDFMDKVIPLFASPVHYPQLAEQLAAASHLPGPRVNLTLSYQFADWFNKAWLHEDLQDMLFGWTGTSAEDAPTNAPREFLPFCGLLALCSYYPHADEATQERIMGRVQVAMNDSRWRVREAAAIGLQRIAEKDFAPVKAFITQHLPEANMLEMRAIIAALAHPPILNNGIARYSLAVSEEILGRLYTGLQGGKKPKNLSILSKGLQYALSVFVAALPEEGFPLLRKFAGLGEPEINRIITANLRKARLVKKYTKQINEIYAIIHVHEEEML